MGGRPGGAVVWSWVVVAAPEGGQNQRANQNSPKGIIVGGKTAWGNLGSSLVKKRRGTHTWSSKPIMSDNFTELIDGPKQFAKESIALIKRCTKPDRREFLQISRAVGVGFLIMGFIGFFVKLIHIPINNIIVGGA